VFVGNNLYSLVPADGWAITYDGHANFLVDGEILVSFNRNEWFFVELV
jgi:hypothetical protein